MRVKGKVVLVTGAGSGIGRACALLLAKEGATIAVTDLHLETARKTADLIHKAGGVADSWRLDSTDEQEVDSVVYSIVKKFGKIDGLVNNAGIAGVQKAPHEVTLDEFQSVMDVNLNGVFLCTKHVVPHMLKNGGGSIVNISSLAGLIGSPYLGAYCASKGAVRLMTKADALTYANKSIRFNSVHSGFIYTPMVQQFLTDRNIPLEQLGAVSPMGIMGEPLDVAYGVLYLISDESKFLTGSELTIDGGLGAS